MFISADTVNKVFFLTTQDSFYEEILKTFFNKKEERNEFRQELWLYLCNKPEQIIEAWNKRYFKYLYIRIVNNEVKSSSSNWHKRFRKKRFELVDELPEEAEEQKYDFIEYEEAKQSKKEKAIKLKLINEALDFYIKQDPWFKEKADLFKMHYYENLSVRQISAKLHNTPITTIWDRIQVVKKQVTKYINNHKCNNSF